MADQAPTSVHVIDPYGNLGTMDASEAKGAIQSGGFRLAGPEEIQIAQNKQTYGQGFGSTAKAFGLGAARSASFGISDELLTKSGAMKPEDIKGYKEAHPIATGAGEVSGILGAVLAPETGILGAVSAPVRGVSRFGGALTEAVAPAAESIAGKIAGKAIAAGAGSAVEGSVYGLGQSVSEHALGDPDLNAERVMANVGIGATIGGALGGAFGAVHGTFEKIAPKFISEVDKKGIAQGDWGSMVNASDVSDVEKTGFMEGLSKRKQNAGEIESAAKELDNAPVLPGMVSDSHLVQKGQSMLLEGPPSIPAIRASTLAAEGFEKAENATQQVLGAETDVTKASLGDTLKGIVSDSVEQQSRPINELYSELKSRFETIPVSDNAIKQISRNIRHIEDVPLSPQARSIAESAAERVESLKTVDDVKRLKSILNQELGLAATPIQKRITSIIADKLANLEENSVVRFAQKEMKTSVAKDRIMSLLDQREAANAQYTVFKDKLQRLGEVLGKKRIHGSQDFLHLIEDLTPEKIADKLSSKNNSGFLDWFSKEFPQGMGSISGYQKNLIRESAMKDGHLNTKMVVDKVFKLPKEYREKIFNADELKKISAVKTYMDSFPKNFNPSNTANASAFRAFFEHPVGAVVANARDFAIQKFIDSAVSSGEKAQGFIDGLSAIERNAIKTTKSIKNGVSLIFSDNGVASVSRGYLTLSATDRRDRHDKMAPHIAELSSNPEQLINHLSEKTDQISQFAPNTALGLQQTMTRATQFLNSKLPTANIPKKTLSQPYKASEAELSKWHKYFASVESPVSILHSIATGSLVPEQVEAVSVVYPKLMNEMKTSVMDKMVTHMSKKKAIPYKTKLSLSLFMGEDLVNSLDPINMIANQNMLATATQAKDQASNNLGRISKSGLDKMKQSNRLLTPMQGSAQRQET